MNVYFESLGCRLNQSELESLIFRFAAAGHTAVGDPAQADVCVVNTCAVTAEAERKSRHRVRALARINSHVRIAAIGCLATMDPQQCAALPGVAWIVPNADKERLLEIVTSSPLSPCARPSRSGHQDEVCPGGTGWVDDGLLHTRAFVKAQDGCDNHCTYCVIRRLRGPSRSRPLADVVASVQSLVKAGYQEAVLTGVNLGAYGRDLALPGGLRTLVAALLSDTDMPRLRLSSLEPWDLDEAFFRLWESPRLCRQLHLPLQAGCDATLRRMGRRTTTAEFARLVRSARAAVPDLAVTTDVIVGFPGEDETAFRASYEFVAVMGFARLHVFRYSPRPGTAAVHLPGQVSHETTRSRARAMGELGSRHAARFRQRFVGQEMAVLWEHCRRDSLWAGLTDNYLQVVTRAGEDLRNRLTATRLCAVQDDHLVGEVIG